MNSEIDDVVPNIGCLHPAQFVVAESPQLHIAREKF